MKQHRGFFSEVRFFPHADIVESSAGPVMNVVELTFDRDDGYDDRLQYTTDPLQPVWIDTDLVLHSTGGAITAQDPAGSSPNKVYRIVAD